MQLNVRSRGAVLGKKREMLLVRYKKGGSILEKARLIKCLAGDLKLSGERGVIVKKCVIPDPL